MIWSLVRIAFRNVTRNTKRSLITMAAVIIGCSCIIFARGFINGLHNSLTKAVTQTMSGDLQIHQADYQKATDALPLNLTVAMDEALEKVLKEDERILAWSGRLRFTGSISNGLTNALFVGNAIDPEHEYKVTPDLQRDVLPGGTTISNDRPDGVVVVDKLADAMGLKVGDTITLTAATKDGALNTVDMTVVGIRKAATVLAGIEGKIVEIPLKTAQDLLYMPNEVTEVVLNCRHLDDAEAVAEDLQARVNQKLTDRRLEVNDWMNVAANRFLVDVLTMQDAVLWIVIVILFLVMVTGIVNTMLMAVMERVREIGTMMAIGIRRSKIVSLFIFEAMFLGLIGATIGAIVGFIVVQIAHRIGIETTIAAYAKPLLVLPEIRFSYLLLVVCIALTSGLIAAIYPAYRASRLEPAEALRTL